jgi:predicted phosphoribosyltransferase
VPVAYEVANSLGAPLDVFLVRKLGIPGHEEMAMEAIASGGVVVLNEDVVRGLGIPPGIIQRVAEQEGRELLRREQAYREGRPKPDVEGKTVILVDDGLATGASMRFTADGPTQTTVELEHRLLERLVDGQAIRGAVMGGGGWGAVLEQYAKAAANQE